MRRRGRPSRKDLGLVATKMITAKIEVDVLEQCKKRFGTVRQAVKFAVQHSADEKAA